MTKNDNSIINVRIYQDCRSCSFDVYNRSEEKKVCYENSNLCQDGYTILSSTNFICVFRVLNPMRVTYIAKCKIQKN